MKAEIRRFVPGGGRGVADPVTRLVIPARQLVIGPGMREVRRGVVTSGTVLREFNVDSTFVKRAERIAGDQEFLANALQRRNKKAWELLNL